MSDSADRGVVSWPWQWLQRVRYGAESAQGQPMGEVISLARRPPNERWLTTATIAYRDQIHNTC